MRRNLEEVSELIKKLKEESNEKIILVEGKKDKEALEKFGIKNVVQLKNRPIFKLTKSKREVIILVDNDEEGEKILRRILQGFQLNRVKFDLRFRKNLKSFGIRKIEELNKLEVI